METFREDFFKSLDPIISDILNKALEDREISNRDAVELFKTKNLDFTAVELVADWLRRKSVGDIVTFVVNRNINFTNICHMGCQFCAFSRKIDDSGTYLLSLEEIILKAKEAWKNGATEVCIQGGLHPKIDAYHYKEILQAVKKNVPIHIHAFSPMEIVYGGSKSKLTVSETLKMLKDAGLDSMPGTAAEILVDEIRNEICPKKINTDEWINVVKTAHKLNIPTTSTILHGHIENVGHWVKHLSIIRDIQRETKGFTEFVPLSFMHWHAPNYINGKTRPGATGSEDMKMYAVSRIMLNKHLKNIQVSWVKIGVKMAQLALNTGANDFGGTLIEENISRSAGATTPQYMQAEEIVRQIKNLGRTPAQRTTTYEIIKYN